MATTVLTRELHLAIHQAKESCDFIKSRVARELGIHRETVAKYWDSPIDSIPYCTYPTDDNPHSEPCSTETEERKDFSQVETGDTSTVQFVCKHRIRTLEDAIKFAEVDVTVWRVKSWETTSWETGMKLRQFNEFGKVSSEAPLKTHQWRVKMVLERILPKNLKDATDAIFERMRKHSPDYSRMPLIKRPSDPHLLEVDIFDHHFGKLCWEPETSNNYDLKIAECLYKNAVDDLLSRAAGYPVERILFPIGQDFFHIDNLESKTTAGTPQDSDGRYAKMYETGEMAVIWAIERLAKVAPVDVCWVPGNHDRLVSYHLVRTVKAWFRSHPQVSVDCGPKVRKYVKYGTSLLGFSHGNEEKHGELPTLMAIEEPELWASTTHREWHLGHFHRPKRTESITAKDKQGVEIRILGSLSGTDSWHYKRALVGGTRAAECYLWSYRDGYCGHFRANARTS